MNYLKFLVHTSKSNQNNADVNLSIDPVYLNQDYSGGQPSAHQNKSLLTSQIFIQPLIVSHYF